MKCNYLFLMCFLCSNAALAADGLGRLFLTPEQRAQLDVVREKRDRRLPVTTETEAAPVVTAPTPQGPDVVTYNGVVRRSDGKSTVWINGKPVNERDKGQTASDVTVLGVGRDGTVSVSVPHVGRRASLKVGQSLDVNAGTIGEPYTWPSTRQRAPENTPVGTAPTVPSAASTATGSTPAPPVPTAAVTSPASAPVTAPATPPSRPVRESDLKEADPDSGAAPAIPRAIKK